MKISSVIITFNEEENIAAAIESLDWADEIVVVDSGSTDRTRDIAESLGARVIINPWPGFSAQKQFATDAAANDWVLSLDADERVSEDLRTCILRVKCKDPEKGGFFVPRLSTYMGRPIRHGGWYPDRQLRLFDRTKGRWSDRLVHESFQLRNGAAAGVLSGEILHRSVTSPAEHHRMIGERYAPLAARQMFAEGRRTSPAKAATSAALSFVRGYILKGGCLDGFPGLCIAWFGAHNTFLKHLILMHLQDSSEPGE